MNQAQYIFASAAKSGHVHVGLISLAIWQGLEDWGSQSTTQKRQVAVAVAAAAVGAVVATVPAALLILLALGAASTAARTTVNRLLLLVHAHGAIRDREATTVVSDYAIQPQTRPASLYSIEPSADWPSSQKRWSMLQHAGRSAQGSRKTNSKLVAPGHVLSKELFAAKTQNSASVGRTPQRSNFVKLGVRP